MAMSTKGRSRGRGRVGSAEFKARCLELVDRVHESHVEYVVTRHGRPVARLVPFAAEDHRPASPLGSMHGTLVKYDRPLDPVPATWMREDRDED